MTAGAQKNTPNKTFDVCFSEESFSCSCFNACNFIEALTVFQGQNRVRYLTRIAFKALQLLFSF